MNSAFQRRAPAREPGTKPTPASRKKTNANFSAAEAAEYIEAMTGELALMAGQANLQMLTYFLNMARVEAQLQISRLSDLDAL